MIRREIVCECGHVIAFLGRQEYRFNRQAARDRRSSRERWHRSRALLFSFAVRRRWHPHADRHAPRPKSSQGNCFDFSGEG
jgi:hypothetical protein